MWPYGKLKKLLPEGCTRENNLVGRRVLGWDYDGEYFVTMSAEDYNEKDVDKIMRWLMANVKCHCWKILDYGQWHIRIERKEKSL